MTPDAKDSSSSFPRWVALASLCIALWLFFANAVPAVRERQALETLETDLATLRDRYDAAIHEARIGGGPAARQDLQGLLVAIDRLGMTPAELCALHPPRAPGQDPEADPAGTGERRTKFP